MMPTQNHSLDDFRLPDETQIGYVHLRVTDLDRALGFYRDLLGFRELEREGATVSLSATGTRPVHLLLTAQRGAQPKPPRTTGLFHVAIRLPDRAALASLFQRLLARDWPLQGAADHAVSEAIYLADPDGNGLELYADRPRDTWTRSADGQIVMVTDPLDARDLLAQARDSAAWDGIAPGTDIGHVHVQVSDLARSETFYAGLLGLGVTQRGYPGALFLAADGYHHHLGVNIWAGQGAPPPPADAVGLITFALRLPDAGSWQALVARLRQADMLDDSPAHGSLQAALHDPDQIGVVLLAAG